MAREEGETIKPSTNRRIKKRLWCAAVLLIIVLIVLGLLWITGLWKLQSAEEKLAAIEAERAIPDEENAAVIYNQLVESRIEDMSSPGFYHREVDTLTQGRISKLLEASTKQECRFTIGVDPQRIWECVHRPGAMYHWAVLLRHVGHDDLRQGRVDAALGTYLCLAQMGKHLRQQPVMRDYRVGMDIEALTLPIIAHFIVQHEPTETHLKMVETALSQTENNWSKDSSMILQVERLLSKQHHGLLRRLILFWRDRDNKEFDRMHEFYLRLLTKRRGIQILIALRRYRTQTEHWPKSLDEIQHLVSKQILEHLT